MSLRYDVPGQKSVDDELSSASSELGSELSDLYREMERTHALHLDVCDVMLSQGHGLACEWVRVPGSDSDPRK